MSSLSGVIRTLLIYTESIRLSSALATFPQGQPLAEVFSASLRFCACALCSLEAWSLSMATIGDAIREAAAERGLNMRTVLKASGVGSATLYGVLGDKRKPRNKTLRKIAQGLGVTVSDLRRRQRELTALEEAAQTPAVRRLAPTGLGVIEVALHDIGGRHSIDWAALRFPPVRARRWLSVDRRWLAEPNDAPAGSVFACVLHGRDLEPVCCDGDILLFDQRSRVRSGDFALAIIPDRGATLGRVFFWDDPQRRLLIVDGFDGGRPLPMPEEGGEGTELVRLVALFRRY